MPNLSQPNPGPRPAWSPCTVLVGHRPIFAVMYCPLLQDFMHPNADQLMRRVEGSTMIRHNGLGENKLLMAAELPRDRQGRYHDGMQNGAPVGVVNTVLKYVMSDDIFVTQTKGDLKIQL